MANNGAVRQVLLVRHAESEANAGERTSDPVGIRITERGRAQAEWAVSLLRETPCLIVVSPFVRTRETAEPLIRRFPEVPVEEWPIQEFTCLDTQLCAGTSYPERRAMVEAYWREADPSLCNGEQCESFASFIERVGDLERRLERLSPERPGAVVVYTHGYVMKALLWRQACGARRIGQEEMRSFDRFRMAVPVPNCGVLFGEIGRPRLRLAEEASVGHIPAGCVTQ